jgi:hypothetical protein
LAVRCICHLPFAYRDTDDSTLEVITPQYQPPEFPIVSLGYDVWGLGASLHELLTQCLPRDQKRWHNFLGRDLNANGGGFSREELERLWASQPKVILAIHDGADERHEDMLRYHNVDHTWFRDQPRRNQALSYHLHRLLGDYQDQEELFKRPDASDAWRQVFDDFSRIKELAHREGVDFDNAAAEFSPRNTALERLVERQIQDRKWNG